MRGGSSLSRRTTLADAEAIGGWCEHARLRAAEHGVSRRIIAVLHRQTQLSGASHSGFAPVSSPVPTCVAGGRWLLRRCAAAPAMES